MNIERPHGGFRTIYADPPWRYVNWSAGGEKKNPVAHYDCVPVEDLRAMPVERLAADNAALFMWATFPMLPEALELMEAWGFAYKSGGAWAKQSPTGRAWAFGTGYILRSAAELLLVGTRGKPIWESRSVRNLWVSPRREHSRKPDEVIADIERLTIGPRLELFARESRPGWTSWGNEATKFDDGGGASPPQASAAGVAAIAPAVETRPCGETTAGAGGASTPPGQIAGRALRRKRRRVEATP